MTIEIPEEDVSYLLEIIQQRKREKEFYDKMCYGLMFYYKTDEWQRHISDVKKRESQEKDKIYKKNRWKRIFKYILGRYKI